MEKKGPIKIVAKMPVSADKVQAFIALAEELVRCSKAEEGNLHYSLNVSKYDPNLLIFTESWRDQAAIDFHNSTEHFTRILPQLREMCADKPSKDVCYEIDY